MHIEHVAIWTNNLEKMKEFYELFFNGKANPKYVNPAKGFESYFITFADGARLELMKKTKMLEFEKKANQIYSGFAHIAFLLPSKAGVDNLTNLLKSKGVEHKDGPRMTGDGYYEACFLDPDGNEIELTFK